ncbi:hypothetical protein CBR_g180 [Chara braunii]|uniref:Cell cycle checkpoint control protein RAD9A n=1 Tax=Chara braunii TaxID=69332 RepID=A0A388JLT0_CHABU|nr:hypothetical protein CBR_g180 [Chara braunii]|eukprot:GBG58780.1 hypothetical protein CBR_g180 [Chara braunii]
MDLVISGSNQLKAICRAVNCLARVGTELLMEAYTDQVVLHTMNAARSALFAVTFKPQFFDEFQVASLSSGIKCSILLKSVCSVLRTTPSSVDKLSISVPNVEAVKVKWSLDCINGIRKTYWISCSQESESIGAILDRTRFSSHLVVKPRDLNRLLVNFQATLQEITLIATEPILTQAPSDYASQPPEVKAVELRSFVDPIKDSTDASLHTQLWIDPREELQEYSHTGEAVDVTFSLKELKAMLAFCEGAEAGMHMYFDKAGDPVLFAPRFGPGDHTMLSDYDATMVLATMLDSVLPQVDRDEPKRENEAALRGNATARNASSPQREAALSAQNCDGGVGEAMRTPARGDEGDRASRLDSAPQSAPRSDRTHVWSDLSATSNGKVSQSNTRSGDHRHASLQEKGAGGHAGIADAGLFDSEPASEEVNLDGRHWANHAPSHPPGPGTECGPRRSQGTPVPAEMQYSTPSHLARRPFYTPQPDDAGLAHQGAAHPGDRQGVARQVIFDKEPSQPPRTGMPLQKVQASSSAQVRPERSPRQPMGNMAPNQGGRGGGEGEGGRETGEIPHNRRTSHHAAGVLDDNQAMNAEELRQRRPPDSLPETETPRPDVNESDLFVMDSEDDEEDGEDCVHSTPPEKRGRIL